jgi:hypothetical protein
VIYFPVSCVSNACQNFHFCSAVSRLKKFDVKIREQLCPRDWMQKGVLLLVVVVAALALQVQSLIDDDYGSIDYNFAPELDHCRSLLNCESCTLMNDCIWCHAKATCMPGNVEGSTSGICSMFDYRFCRGIV